MSDEPDADEVGLPIAGVTATMVLTAITGFVDAVAYSYLFGTFPANQSGNIILLGIALGDGELFEAPAFVVAVLGFALGVAAGVALIEVLRGPLHRRTRIVLTIELVMLVVVTCAIGILGEGHEPFDGPVALLLLATTAAAMGVQTPAIVRTHGVPTPTTYMTGSIAHLSRDYAEAALPGPAPERRARARRGIVLTVVLAGYLGGAAAGAAIGSAWSMALVVPTIVLAALLIVHRSLNRRATQDRPGSKH